MPTPAAARRPSTTRRIKAGNINAERLDCIVPSTSGNRTAAAQGAVLKAVWDIEPESVGVSIANFPQTPGRRPFDSITDIDVNYGRTQGNYRRTVAVISRSPSARRARATLSVPGEIPPLLQVGSSPHWSPRNQAAAHSRWLAQPTDKHQLNRDPWSRSAEVRVLGKTACRVALRDVDQATLAVPRHCSGRRRKR